jgi:hypothetical protein
LRLRSDGRGMFVSYIPSFGLIKWLVVDGDSRRFRRNHKDKENTSTSGKNDLKRMAAENKRLRRKNKELVAVVAERRDLADTLENTAHQLQRDVDNMLNELDDR